MTFEKGACTMKIVGVVLLYHTFIGLAQGNNYLNISGIRLENGTGRFGGRVEISINGVWGTVCDDSFDMNDANVMCRMMDLTVTGYVPGAFYGQGTGPIFAQEFKCNGQESHLKYCSYVSNVQCTHAMDISLVCTECGEIETDGAFVKAISQNGSVLTAACKEWYSGLDFDTSVCKSDTWSVPSISCKPDLKGIRLANGIGLFDGRVELLINGVWGTICLTSSSHREAQAICNILFGTRSLRAWYTSSYAYGAGTGPIYIDDLDCKGTETDLNQCTYSLDMSCKDHDHDFAVACNVFPLNITDSRLINGTGPYDGRIEFYVDGHWGTIDRRFVDMYDAKTVCNTHGASLAMIFDAGIYGQGAGPMLTAEIYCYRERDHINSCSIFAPYRTLSLHQYDLSIACTPCGSPDIFNGDPVAFSVNELTVKCQTGFSPNLVTMTCLMNNTWSQEQMCAPDYAFPLNISDIQLYNLYIPSEGRVKIMVNGVWGTVCDRNFDSADSSVICKMMGLQYSRHYRFYTPHNYKVLGSDPIYVNNLNCTGTESHINMCTYDISNNCTHYEDVAVECTGYHLNITGIRLAGTKGPYHGRVELKVNGTWGTVCDNRFWWEEVSTICKMFGLNYRMYFHGANYGQGSGPIYVDRLDCTYSDSHINDCKYSVNNYYNCGHNKDVSVMCYGPKLNVTGAKLVNGTDLYDGRAEIKVNDTWGTICDANFNILAADLFCKIIGLRAAQYFTGAIYGEGSGPVFIDQIFCETHDTSLSSCKYLFLNECSHGQDVSIVCNECGQPDIAFWGVDFFTYNDTILYADCSYYKTYAGKLKLTCDNQTQNWITEGECQEYRFPLNITDIRLADGPSKTEGRVELKSLDTWGTVCDNSFGMQEADAFCSMLGYPPAVTYYRGAYYGEGKGPIFVDDLNCVENVTHINDCSYNTYDNCDHGDDISVVCTDCGDPTPENGFVNSSMTNYGAAVHVACNKNYNLIGDFDILCRINATWSNVPTCKQIDCGNPKPANGNINTTSTTNATIAAVWCDEGYTLSGDSVITCQTNETWTDYPNCYINDCNIPEPPFADVTLLDNKTTFGETAKVSCWTGYTPTESTLVSCLANGTWEMWPECEIVDCDDPTPQRGFANNSETTFDTVLKITCETGYNLTGESEIRCQEDGTWTDYPVCDTSDCGKFSVANGEVNTTLGTLVGATATVECDEGYDIQGSSVAICTASGWNETISCQIQVCNDPTPDNGKVINTDGEGEYVFGNYVDIECNTGYSLRGDSLITCESGGKWSERPTCELIDCGNLTPPSDGRLDDSKGTKYGAKITFHCNEDYLLVGVATTMCGADGKWGSEVPACVRKSEDGGYCHGDEYCLMEGSKCIDSACECVTGIYDIRTKKCDKMPLLPYGIDKGDEYISGTTCGTTSFLPGVPVAKKMRKKIVVCPYGFLTFDSMYTNPTPPKNKESVVSIDQEIILATFYAAGIDRKNSGPVYYRQYDILNSYNEMRDDAKTVSFIENIVQKFGKLESYEANFILIATWHETKSTVTGFNSGKTSTFQAVLVSDGKSTYVFYIYGQGKMNWDINDSVDTQVMVGTYVANDVVLTNTHPFSFTSEVLHLDQQPEVPISKDDVAGLFFQQLNLQETEYKNDAVDCIRWHTKNYDQKKHLDYIASLTPECPCDIWLSRFDPWFWQIGLQRRRKDVTYACVDMLHAGNYGHYGKSCCYDLRTWLWVYERPHAGGFRLYHPRFQREYKLNDETPKNLCCYKSDYCNLYYDLRPTGSCYVSSSYTFGTFWGDPHFITLDRMNFTFNGLGEYTLLQIRTHNLTFDLQARTERAVKKDGNLSDATVFSAFAVKDSSNASLHVELNKAKTGMILYGNSIDLTKQFYTSTNPEDPFVYTTNEGNLVISKRDETLSVLFPTSGISLNISVGVEMLALNTGVPVALRGLTEGLLGNYDGNPNNDFTMPNGTVLNSNLTEREIFEYGKTWSIIWNNSAFIYEDGKSHFDFHNASYVPRFLDEADPVKKAEAEKACNGSQNIECVFDLIFTERSEIADQTSSIKGRSESTKEELDKTVPSLSGCSVIHAEVGTNAYCNITADPGSEINFIENNVNAAFDHQSSSISFQATDDPVYIRVSAQNNDGRKSPEFVVDIIFCDCNGRGVCTNQTREDSRETAHFKYALCECEPQYQGNNCEEDFDGCAASPCSLGRNCTSLTAMEQKAQNKSYICGACPYGFTVNNEDECDDVDECLEGLHTCEQICINTEGSYSCACKDGFRVDSRNKSNCKDINECEQALHNCSHICINTEGGFACQCYAGFEFNVTTWSCNEVSDESCNESERDVCTNTSGCTLVEGRPECFCNDGYELDESGKCCQDTDECSRGVCPHDCLNTDGSFQCVCFTGFQLKDSTTCTACRVPKWGVNCEQTCTCTGRGADRCDPVKGCICKTGWHGETCNQDIDECSSILEMCDDPRKTCTNTLGSYKCVCKTGFHLTENEKCEDLDECAEPQLNECTQDCTNTIGSYSCKCRNGYTRYNETFCTDIDECELGTAKCEQRCTNNIGLYTCSCQTGYTLNDDRQTCTKLSDPCLTVNNLNCSQLCVLSEQDAVCGCQKGYYLESDNETCTDINECEDGEANKCDSYATCINTAGSFECECPAGSQLENDGRTCSECDAYHYGRNCLQNCSCLYGTCDKTKGCICDKGWLGNNCDIDINECDTKQVVCTDVNTVCVNILGDAICSCDTGYKNNSGHCEDIDECSDTLLNSCDQKCINSVGSYTCTCQSGFVLKDGICTDTDECLGSHGCDQTCENTVGSYSCSCDDGFKLDLKDRKSCRPENECTDEEKRNCTENSSCFVNNDEVRCACLKGFQENGVNCEDVDECREDINPCSQNCINTEGSFVCNCDVGYYLQDDKVSCQECIAWKYGQECRENCSCDILKTELCNSETGKCKCRSGWNGTTCNEDIDECKLDISCPGNSVCKNSLGSFECTCNKGYIKTGAQHCEECDNRHFGDSCLEECKCNIENTKDCHHETGECICKQGWQGTNCTIDVNECLENSSICESKANSFCRNYVGSFDCICNDGFSEENDKCIECEDNTYGYNCSEVCTCDVENTISCDHINGSCNCKEGWNGTQCSTDIDECTENKKICETKANSTCQNEVGSYTCACDYGFRDQRDECTACELWTYGLNCESNCTCEIQNTDTCDSENGKCTCKTGWNGTNCENDINECAHETLCPGNSSCVNSDGSFACICHTGYMKSDGNICKECDAFTYGDECSKKCTCNVDNTHVCNHVNGSCTCAKGWKDEQCQTDVNECTEDVTICDFKANSTCKNENGSYSCICNSGLREEDGICTDCDEWNFGENCESNCTCDTTKTKFCNPKTGKCTCEPGWNGTSCQEDINECDIENICPTNSSCENAIGSFKCRCNKGFTETEQGKCAQCVAFTYGDECSKKCTCNVNTTLVCDHVDGRCSCAEGWKGAQCMIDIDECAENETICEVKANSTCENENGSYSCFCNIGFQEEDEICTACELWTYGLNCESNCTCVIQNTDTCDSETGKCTCKTGWNGTNCENDINECAHETLCPGNSSCVNSDGSFACICHTGYMKSDGNICKECDAFTYGDECSKKCTCNVDNTHVCNHVNGSCTCAKGWKDEQCQTDVNECTEDVTICDVKANSTCKNENGSYSCICNSGLREEDGICTDCNEWKFGENCESNCTCDTTNTKFCNPKTGKCTCEPGWNGTSCQGDINECDIEDICPTNSSCENAIGSFKCRCNKGFSETQPGKCAQCVAFTYGDECRQNCTCNVDTTLSCDHVDGRCSCAEGWKGAQCLADIDECTENVTICEVKSNSTCENENGSYSCICNNGFREENDICKVCTGDRYGTNCSLTCNCNASNAVNKDQTCKPDTGTCECKLGWDGDTCNVDVNECDDSTACIAKNNTTCVNTFGSFLCDCLRGFINNSDGNCITDIRPTTAKPGKAFSHQITISADLPPGTNLASVTSFSRLRKEIETILQSIFGRYTSAPIEIKIDNIRNGSIIVDYTVVYGNTTKDTASELMKAVLDLEQGSEITFYGQNVSVSSDGYKDMEPCEVYHILIGACGQGYQCKAENNTPICRLEKDESEINWSLVIGLSGAGFCLMIITTITVVYLRHRTKEQKIKKQRMRRARYLVNDDGNYGSAVDKVHRWREGNVTGHGQGFPNWMNKLSRPNFRAYENNAYSQPYQISRDRLPRYSIGRDYDE